MHLPLTTLAAIVDGRWQPRIGDPSVLGWLTVATYALAAVACSVAGRREDPSKRGWRILSLMLALLAVNKAFDLPSWFTDVGRRMSRGDGWQGLHGPGQTVLAAVIALVGAAAAAWVGRRLARHGARPAFRVAALAVAYQIAFVAVRAVSLHAIDHALGTGLGPLRINHVLELAGLFVVLAAAVTAARDGPDGH
jgi:hypothetical protein